MCTIDKNIDHRRWSKKISFLGGPTLKKNSNCLDSESRVALPKFDNKPFEIQISKKLGIQMIGIQIPTVVQYSNYGQVMIV